jgi:hypothetical protein
MSFGIDVRNSSNRVQINDSYVNISVIKEGTSTVGSSSGAIGQLISTAVPVVGYSSAAGDILAIRNGRGYGRITSNGFVFVTEASDTYSMEWQILRRVDLLPATSGYGLEVYNTQENVVFSTAHKSMLIQDIISGIASSTKVYWQGLQPYIVCNAAVGLFEKYYEEDPVPSEFSYKAVYCDSTSYGLTSMIEYSGGFPQGQTPPDYFNPSISYVPVIKGQ